MLTQETMVIEHDDIADLSAFDFKFEKRRSGWQDLDGRWHPDDGLTAGVLEPDQLTSLKTGAVVNTSLGTLGGAKMGDFGGRYKLVDHVDFFDQANQAIMAQEELDWHNVRVIDTVYEWGSKVQRAVHFLSHTKNFGGADDVCLRSDTFNSVDQSWQFQQFIGAYRSLCRNTLFFGGERTYPTKRRHTSNLNIEAIIGKASAALGLFASNVEMLDQLRSITCTEAEAIELFAKTLCKKNVKPSDRIDYLGNTVEQVAAPINRKKLDYLIYRYREDLADLGDNLWLVYNCLTHWSTHVNETWERETIDRNGNTVITELKTGQEGAKHHRVRRMREAEVAGVLASPEWQEKLAA